MFLELRRILYYLPVSGDITNDVQRKIKDIFRHLT